MKINIPEKYREEFDRSADFAVASGKFTPKELAEHLGVGELVASIMIGYMEKTGLVTKGKNDEVRRARISAEEWEKIEKKIENYIPVPEKEAVEALPLASENELPIIENESFFEKRVTLTRDTLLLEGLDRVEIALRDIAKIFILKPRFLKKGVAVFSASVELDGGRHAGRADAVTFKKKDFERMEALAERLSEYLGIQIEKI